MVLNRCALFLLIHFMCWYLSLGTNALDKSLNDEDFVGDFHGSRLKDLDIDEKSSREKMKMIQVPKSDKLHGCATANQTFEYLQTVTLSYPEISQQIKIGVSIEGNPILVLCLGKSCVHHLKQPTPSVFLNAMHHGKECMSLMTILYTIQEIIEGYFNGKPWATNMIETRTVFFLPIVNPDGYMWNEEHIAQSAFSSLARKNRHNFSCSNDMNIGVDLNRNYPVCWDSSTDDTSDQICAENYRGESPFSEPETMAIKTFLDEHNIATAVNLHSFGRKVLLPYSCKSMNLSLGDDQFFRKYGKDLAAHSNYSVGRVYDNEMRMYSVGGDAADWMYHEKNIYAVSLEIGGNSFWLKGEEITNSKEIASEGIPMLLNSVWASGSNLRVDAIEIYANETEEDPQQLKSAYLAVNITNAGVQAAKGNITILLVIRSLNYKQSVNIGRALNGKYDHETLLFSIPGSVSSHEGYVIGIKYDSSIVYHEIDLSVFSLTRNSHVYIPDPYLNRYINANFDLITLGNTEKLSYIRIATFLSVLAMFGFLITMVVEYFCKKKKSHIKYTPVANSV